MHKWEDLKVYRNLLPEEIPNTFKEFGRQVVDRLNPWGFNLKESRTEKRLFRFVGDFEQGIYFDNSSRVKNQKDFRIHISIKPFFTETPHIPYWIFQAFQIDSAFKMSYPLTQEYSLLSNHITDKIEKLIIPFFEKYSTVDLILSQHRMLLNHYKLPYDGSIPPNSSVEKLIYDCSFRARSKDLFQKYHSKYLQERQIQFQQLKNHPEYGPRMLKEIEGLEAARQAFDNDELFDQEIKKQNERILAYKAQIAKKK